MGNTKYRSDGLTDFGEDLIGAGDGEGLRAQDRYWNNLQDRDKGEKGSEKMKECNEKCLLVPITDSSEDKESEAKSTTSENEDEEDGFLSGGDDEPRSALSNGRKSNTSFLFLDLVGGRGRL